MLFQNTKKKHFVTVAVWTVARKVTQPLKKFKKIKINFFSSFRKSNLTNLTTDVIFSGQRFAILAMFFFIKAAASASVCE